MAFRRFLRKMQGFFQFHVADRLQKCYTANSLFSSEAW